MSSLEPNYLLIISVLLFEFSQPFFGSTSINNKFQLAIKGFQQVKINRFEVRVPDIK